MNVTVDADVLMSTLPVELCKAQSKRMPLAEKLLRLLKITCRIEKLAGLTQASGELGTGIIQTAIKADGLFLNLLLDPSVAGRAGGFASSPMA